MTYKYENGLGFFLFFFQFKEVKIPLSFNHYEELMQSITNFSFYCINMPCRSFTFLTSLLLLILGREHFMLMCIIYIKLVLYWFLRRLQSYVLSLRPDIWMSVVVSICVFNQCCLGLLDTSAMTFMFKGNVFPVIISLLLLLLLCFYH